MRIGLIGLPGCGKSTSFRVLSGHAGTDSHHGATVAVVPLPDLRLDRVCEILKPKKKTYADIAFVDFESLHRGDAAHGALALQKAGGDCDAFALVVQGFGDLDHQGQPLRPAADLQTLLLEMALSDLRIVGKHLERISTGPKPDRSARDIVFFTACNDHLTEGGLLQRLQMTAEEERHLRGFSLLTMKPLMVVLNLGEDDRRSERTAAAQKVARDLDLPCLETCAELEHEIAELPAEDQLAFMADYGLEGSARERFLRQAFSLLDLITFFTVNESEARAWTIRRGATAPEAAGKVHSDMQAGFIRAEVTPFQRLDATGSMAQCRERGYQRVEGKEYVVADGDLLQIRFSR